MDTGSGVGPLREDQEPIAATPARTGTAASTLDGAGERRDAPRSEILLACTVTVGGHVHEGFLRDVLRDGAMVHGLRGVLLGDAVRLRVPNLTERAFGAELREISLLGFHLAITDAQDLAAWHKAVAHLLPEEPAEGSR